MRPAAIAGASVGFAGIALQVLREAAFGQEIAPALGPACDCPVFDWSGGSWTWDIPSVLLGLLAGLALGPVLECLVLARQLLSIQLRSYFTRVATRGSYRILA